MPISALKLSISDGKMTVSETLLSIYWLCKNNSVTVYEFWSFVDSFIHAAHQQKKEMSILNSDLDS